MTNKEAIARIEDMIQWWSLMTNGNSKCEELENAIYALKKQIPKSVMAFSIGGEIVGSICSECGKELVASDKDLYCKGCGQMLDWGDGDEAD